VIASAGELTRALFNSPSSIIPNHRIFMLNPAHSLFTEIGFQPFLHFQFDPHLKK